jgi:hypothetical protein
VKDAAVNEFEREKREHVKVKLKGKLNQINKILKYMEQDEEGEGKWYDYMFTNAPHNEHNLTKRDVAGKDGTVVIDGGYTVEVSIASRAVIGGVHFRFCQFLMDGEYTTNMMLAHFSTNLIVTGGDACVPPNSLAAYGATLACVAAKMLVNLAVAHGHLNAIIIGMVRSFF